MHTVCSCSTSAAITGVLVSPPGGCRCSPCVATCTCHSRTVQSSCAQCKSSAHQASQCTTRAPQCMCHSRTVQSSCVQCKPSAAQCTCRSRT
eukprot:scaffold108721_cov25-Tisochrysis_lutea.AAC.1